MNVRALSYAGTLTVNAAVDPGHVPDLLASARPYTSPTPPAEMLSYMPKMKAS